jgi:glycosyltransferase involved in cell wall biosynthesis
MRIAYLLTRSDGFGGACIHVRDLAKSVQASGHDVKVFIGGNGPFAHHLRDQQVSVVSINNLDRSIHPLRDFKAGNELLAQIRKFRPDIICAHTAKAGFLGRYVANVLRLPVILTAHGWSVTNKVGRRHGPFFRLLEQLAAKFTDRIIDVCESERRLALSFGIGKPEQHSVVYNGVADIAPDLVASHAPTNSPRITMIARFEVPKNHAMLFRALSSLKDHQWALDLIGDGPLLGKSKELAIQLGISQRVRFLGSQSQPERYLADSDIFVLCSDFEGLPLTILEAMRAGLAVVASDVGGIAEAVENGRTGLLTTTDRNLSEALTTLLENPELREKMGREGRKIFLDKFLLEQMLAHTLKIYEDVAPCP